MTKGERKCPHCLQESKVKSIKAIVDGGTITGSTSARIYSTDTGSLVGRAISSHREVSGLAARFTFPPPQPEVQLRWAYISVVGGFVFYSLIVVVKGLNFGSFAGALVAILFMGGLLGVLLGILVWMMLSLSAASRFSRSREILLKIYDAERDLHQGFYCSRCDVAFLLSPGLAGSPEYLRREILLMHLGESDRAILSRRRISWRS